MFRPDELWSVRFDCRRIRRLLALRQPRLAQPLDDALDLAQKSGILTKSFPYVHVLLHGQAGF